MYYYDFGFNRYRKINFLRFPHINALGSKFDLAVKLVEVNSESSSVPTSPILHSKSQGHCQFGSREVDFKGCLPYVGVAVILIMRP